MSLDYLDLGDITIGGVPLTDPMFQVFPESADPNWMPYDPASYERAFMPTIDYPFGSPSGNVRVANFPEEPFTPQQSLMPSQGFPAGTDPLAVGPEGALGGEFFVDTATNAVYDGSGRMVATPEEMAQGLTLVDKLQGIHSDPTTTPEQKAAAEQGFWASSGKFLETGWGKLLATLVLGGVGLGVAELMSGDQPRMGMPAPTPPPAGVTAARDALNQALTTQAGGQSASMAGLLGPGATAGDDLQSLFRMGIAGQRNLADLGLGRSAQEILADAEQAPLERALRMQSLGELPGLLGPSAGVAPTIRTGLNLSQALQGLQAPQPGQLVNPAMLADPTREALSARVQSLLGQQGQGGAEGTDAIRDQMRTRLQSLLSQGPGQQLNDPIRQQLAQQISAMLGQGGPGQGFMLDDPIRSGLQDTLQRALAGQTPTTALDRQFREEEAQLRNRLFQAMGAGYETSSPGIEALQKLRESQQLRQEEFGRQTIASFGPQEFQRRQFGTQFPEQQYQQRLGLMLPQEFGRRQFDITNPQQQYLAELGLLGPQEAQRTQFGQNLSLSQLQTLLPAEFSRFQFGTQFPESQYLNRLNSLLPAELQRAQFGEQVRQQGIANRQDLSTMGRRPIGETATTLGSIVPISPILNLGTEAQERQQQDALRQQLAMQSFSLDAQERQRRAQAVGGIFGQAASTLTAPQINLIGRV